MLARVSPIAHDNSLSIMGTPKGKCHQNIGSAAKNLCEGLNSHNNAGRRSPRDLTAYALRGLRGDGTSIVVTNTKGSSLVCSRSFHSSHKPHSLEPNSKRNNVSVRA